MDGQRMTEMRRSPLAGAAFDVAIIGGGINGVAIARECGCRGLRTLLVEKHDFASGTTSRSTRIIHGGLRYLEHAELGLVRESLRERRRLLQEFPNLVRPIRFLLALDEHSNRNALTVRGGLWMYRQLGGKLNVDSAELEIRRLEQVLDSGRKWSIFDFEDGQCEFPERLVADWLIEAIAAGVVVRNHSEALAVEVSDGAVHAIRLRDAISGAEERIEANRVINAAGPWVDLVLQNSGLGTRAPLIGGVRGSHIVIPRFPGMPKAAVYSEAVDGRPIFVIPWNGQILVGTTEVPDRSDPGTVAPAPEEIDYLLKSVAKMFPQAGVQKTQVRYTFAGIRPLPATQGADFGAISRRHFLHDHREDGVAGMISVIGGKLTTAGELARQCAAKMGLPAQQHEILLVASDPIPAQDWQKALANAGLSPEITAAVIAWNGTRSRRIAENIRNRPELGAPLCDHSHHIVAEATDALEFQCAVTLGDVLLRRVPVALGPCWEESCSRTAAHRIGTAMNWSEKRMHAELESFQAERAAFLHQP